MAEKGEDKADPETHITYFLHDQPGVLNGSVAAAGHLAAIVAV
jgi:hypothetical protein